MDDNYDSNQDRILAAAFPSSRETSIGSPARKERGDHAFARARAAYVKLFRSPHVWEARVFIRRRLGALEITPLCPLCKHCVDAN